MRTYLSLHFIIGPLNHYLPALYNDQLGMTRKRFRSVSEISADVVIRIQCRNVQDFMSKANASGNTRKIMRDVMITMGEYARGCLHEVVPVGKILQSSVRRGRIHGTMEGAEFSRNVCYLGSKWANWGASCFFRMVRKE